MNRSDISVVHSIPVWLGQTLTWVDNQLRHLPARVRTSVACDRTENLDQFSCDSLFALSEAGVRGRLWRSTRVSALHRGFLRGCIEAQRARVVHAHFGPRGHRHVEEQFDIAVTATSLATHYDEVFGH